MGLSFTSDTDYIKIDGVSSDTVGLYFDYLEVPPMARQRFTEWTTRNDENGFSRDDTYENIVLPLNCYTFMNDDYDNTAIYEYFSIGDKLELSRLSGYYYKIVDMRINSIQQRYGGKRIDYSLTFTLSPFRYSISNNPISLTNGGTVAYSGTRYGKPVISGVVGAAGDIIVYSSDGSVQDILTVKDCTVGETLYIDTQRKIVHDGTNVILNRVEGSYPILRKGNNTITWSGTFNSVQMVKNERWY